MSLLQRLVPLLLAGCTAASSSNEPAPEAPAPRETPAPTPSETHDPIRVSARYPATLLYALDGAAGMPNHDAGYARWLLGSDVRPAWLVAYGARRPSWSGATRADAAPELDTCGWSTESYDALVACVRRVLPEGERAIAETALREAHALLQPRWESISVRPRSLVPELETVVRSEVARGLSTTLRRSSRLPEATPLAFEVVLVAKPPGSHSFARQQGPYLVHEVDPKVTVGSLASVTFHEIAHLAHALSPARADTERAFMAHGDAGKVAANIWDEAVATAFGNGLAAEKLDPTFRAAASFYDDTWIDTVGRALYLGWKEGREPTLGPTLAPLMVETVGRVWPEDKRAAERYLWSCTIRADDKSVLAGALEGIHARSVYRRTPVDDTVPGEVDLPPWAPRVVLVTAAQLEARPALRKRVAIPEESWTDALVTTGTAVFRHDDADGTLVLVIVADDVERLRTALPRFARGTMTRAGWSVVN